MRLLAVFVAHNLEEVCHFRPPLTTEALERLRIDAGWYRRDRFAAATILLTVAVAALTPSVDQQRGRRWALVGAATAGGLVLNAGGHLVRAAITHSYNPGAVSAPILLGVAFDSLAQIARRERLAVVEVGTAAGLGAVLSIPAIVGALALTRSAIR